MAFLQQGSEKEKKNKRQSEERTKPAFSYRFFFAKGRTLLYSLCNSDSRTEYTFETQLDYNIKGPNMAEIKSTMEMVLERAARMAEAAPEVSDNEDLVKSGMKLAADYINSGNADFATPLDSHSPEDQVSIKKGMAQTLLRNIVLPRDEDLQSTGQTAL